MSAYPNSDLNPVLAAGNCKVKVISTGELPPLPSLLLDKEVRSFLSLVWLNLSGGRREVPLNQDFFVGFGKTILKPEDVVVSVFIPFTRKVQNSTLLDRIWTFH